MGKLSALVEPLSKTQCLRELSGHKSVLHVANNSQSYMTDKIIWRRSFPNHFLIQHADTSDTCVVQNCHNLRRGYISQTRCDLGLIWRNLNASLDLSSSWKDWSSWFLFQRLLLLVAGCEGLKQYKQRNCRCHFAVVQQTIVDDMIGLEMEDGMYCGQVGQQFNPNQIASNHALWHIVNF